MIEPKHPDALNTGQPAGRGRFVQGLGVAGLIIAGVIAGAKLWQPVQGVERRVTTPIREVVRRQSPLEQLPDAAASACPSVVSLHLPGLRGAAPQAVLVSTDGLAVTTAPVPAQGTFDAWLDGRMLKATLRAQDAPSGLSLLKLDGAALPVAMFADPDIAPPGTWGFALSSPNGSGCIVEQGIVASDFVTDGATLDYYVRIHTSGDPLPAGTPFFSPDGRVVALAQPTSGEDALPDRYLPADLVTVIVSRLMRASDVRPDVFGLVTEDIPPVLAARLAAERGRGAVIVLVAPGSIAQAAGLHVGDVILSAADMPISGSSELARALGGGEPIDLIVTRGRDRTRSTFTLTPPPSSGH